MRGSFALRMVLTWVTEIPAAALVGVEVVILFAGVIWRYALDSPLVWSDELAEMLFLWLAMLGAVIALRRREHMCMTALVARLPPRRRRFLGAVVAMAVVTFVAELLPQAASYMISVNAITSPTLGIPDSWRVAGLVVALVLLLVAAVEQLLGELAWRELLAAAMIVALLGLGFWSAQPELLAMREGSLVIFFVGLVSLCIAAGVPIAFSFGLSTLAYIMFGTHIPLSIVVDQMDQGMSSIELLAVPMFVLLGLLLEMSGIARVLVELMSALVGHKRGGLSYVLLGAMYLISGISGSKAADQAAVAPVLFPEMKRRGSHPGELVAQLAAAAAMSETIPPSLVLIIVGSVTGVSISALFTGGLLPATVAAVALVAVIAVRSRSDVPSGRRATPAQLARAFVVAIPALVLPFLIRFVVLEGIATATEVATVGVVYAAIVGLIVYRCFDWRRLFPILVDTASLSGAILLIIGTATSMAWALTQAGFAQSLATMMTNMPGGRIGFLAISIVVFVILGSVLEGLPAMVLFGPLLFPVARGLGINEVHYAIVAILAMGIGLFSPPFGVGFYQTCLIGRVTSDEALGKIWPYLGALGAALVIVAAVPWLSTGFLH
ncbi:MAG: TRAP transporter large permease subunit [Rhodospirillales bacterium]|nr:TRAP transporter large permease subunit [Rhodospirillales bacterium]